MIVILVSYTVALSGGPCRGLSGEARIPNSGPKKRGVALATSAPQVKSKLRD